MTAERPLDIFAYSVGYFENGGVPNTQWDTLNFLGDVGFKINRNNRIFSTAEEVLDWYRYWLENIHDLDYGCDGLVVKVNRIDYQQHLGDVGREPRWAIAYKFPAEQAITTLEDIAFNVGRTGTINPYAKLTPVYVGGATVSRATLHNEDYITTRDLRPGDRVVVERAGEVIPQVVRTLDIDPNRSRPAFSMPEICPGCKTPISRPGGDANWYCNNAACPDQLVRLVEHFVSKGAMDIEGLGIKQGVAFIEEGLLSDVADIYRLADRREQLLEMERMAEKSVSNLLEAIEKSKSRPLSSVLVALGIGHVGSEVAAILARQFGSMEAIQRASQEDLVALNTIGPKIAESVVGYFANQSNRDVVQKLADAGVNMVEETASANGGATPLEGLRFVVTGRLPNYSRSAIQDRIKDLGGAVSGSVSKKTNYLVAGEDAGSKLTDAEKLEVEILSEEEFESLVAGMLE